MLAAETDDVGSALRRIEQQAQREPGASAERMPRFKRLDIGLSPCAEAVRFDLRPFHALGGIAGAPALFDAIRHYRPDGAQEVSGSRRRAGFRRNHGVDMLPLQQCDPFVAMLGAKSLKDVAAHPPRLRGEPR